MSIIFYKKVKFTMKNKVKIYRKGHGLTQEQLANIIGVSRQTIHSVEKGKFNPNIGLAFKLSQFFHISAEELFMIEENLDIKKLRNLEDEK